VAGQVAAAGANVTRFKPGDEVFGLCIDDPKGTGVATLTHCHGAFAEFACALDSALTRKPNNVTFEQAAAVPIAALTALQGLRDSGRTRPGCKVLIHGAAGGVGTFAVQIAKALGAEVTAVSSTKNLELVRSIGADRVIDYTREDFTGTGQRYDVIFDCYANHRLSAVRSALNPRGVYVMAGGAPSRWIVGLVARPLRAAIFSPFLSQKFVTFLAHPKQSDLDLLGDYLATGKLKPVIDRCYPLSDAREAFQYLEDKQAHGKLVIAVS